MKLFIRFGITFQLTSINQENPKKIIELFSSSPVKVSSFMLSEVLVLIKNQLSLYMQAGLDPIAEPGEEKVVFIKGNNLDPLTFEDNTISVLLINIEEEKNLRPADLYRRINADGSQKKIQPDILLNLYILFIANFEQYERSLNALSMVLQYFQNHRLLNHQNTPDLNENIDKLIIELITLPFSEQNEVWSSLRIAYHPSVLYKVGMVVFRDEESTDITEITKTQLNLATE